MLDILRGDRRELRFEGHALCAVGASRHHVGAPGTVRRGNFVFGVVSRCASCVRKFEFQQVVVN
nr:hypothetical protein [Streptomyces sp. TML10]